MSRRVLYIAYAYPPTGGAGVQRTAKFVKYLPEHGWQPSVLTVANPSVPLLDQSLHADVPETVLVRRARTLEPGYAVKAAVTGSASGSRRGLPGRQLARRAAWQLSRFVLQPDPQILWMPGAVRAGMRLLREKRHDAIVATAPPFSSLLIGAALSRRSGVPLVLDYRDEWDLSSAYWENRRGDLFSRWLQGAMQRRVVRRAHVLVATTQASARALERIRIKTGGHARVACIYNGYDPDDLPATSPAPRSDGVYRLAYVGTLWNLTAVAPLVQAVRLLAERNPELASRLELVFAGRRTPQQQADLETVRGTPCRLVEHPYLDHRQAVELMTSADTLCVLLADLPGAERVVPAKIFESMATRRPILAIAPRGELWDLLRGYPAGHPFTPSDTANIAGFLADEIRQHDPKRSAQPVVWDGSAFERRQLAGQLAELLDAIAPPLDLFAAHVNGTS